jgi:hypothetical protein
MESVKKKLESEVKDSNHTLSRNISELESGLARLTGHKVTLK